MPWREGHGHHFLHHLFSSRPPSWHGDGPLSVLGPPPRPLPHGIPANGHPDSFFRYYLQVTSHRRTTDLMVSYIQFLPCFKYCPEFYNKRNIETFTSCGHRGFPRWTCPPALCPGPGGPTRVTSVQVRAPVLLTLKSGFGLLTKSHC